MQKISRQEFVKSTAYIEAAKDRNHRIFFFDQMVCVVSKDGSAVYMNDNLEHRFYRVDSRVLVDIYHSLRNLYLKEITVHRFSYEGEGSSLGIDQLLFVVGPVTFDFKGLRELVYGTERAKYVKK